MIGSLFCLVYLANLIWFETTRLRPQSKCLVSFLFIDFILSSGEWWVMFQCYVNGITLYVRSLSHGQGASGSALISLVLRCLCVCFYCHQQCFLSSSIILDLALWWHLKVGYWTDVHMPWVSKTFESKGRTQRNLNAICGEGNIATGDQKSILDVSELFQVIVHRVICPSLCHSWVCRCPQV